jgi:hypothetical protein
MRKGFDFSSAGGEQQSVATPQAARGRARPPCRTPRSNLASVLVLLFEWRLSKPQWCPVVVPVPWSWPPPLPEEYDNPCPLPPLARSRTHHRAAGAGGERAGRELRRRAADVHGVVVGDGGRRVSYRQPFNLKKKNGAVSEHRQLVRCPRSDTSRAGGVQPRWRRGGTLIILFALNTTNSCRLLAIQPCPPSRPSPGRLRPRPCPPHLLLPSCRPSSSTRVLLRRCQPSLHSQLGSART